VNASPNPSFIASSNVNTLRTAPDIETRNSQTGEIVGSDLQMIVSSLNSIYPENLAEFSAFSFPSEKVKMTGMRSLLNFMSRDVARSREEVMFFHSVLINGPEKAIAEVVRPMFECLRPLRALLDGLESTAHERGESMNVESEGSRAV